MDVMQAMLSVGEVAAVARRSTSSVDKWAGRGWLTPVDSPLEHRKYDRLEVERCLAEALPAIEVAAAQRRLRLLALGAAMVQDGEVIEIAHDSATAEMTDDDLLELVRTSSASTRDEFDLWAADHGAPRSEQLMQRLATFYWTRLLRRAAPTG